jgi:hypothetical protein
LTVLTERFARAVDYARIAHAGQTRKGTDIPYLTHLLSVASLVIEFGGSEDQAIAGLLHDTIEDCGEAHEPISRPEFGDAMADIVVAASMVPPRARASTPTPRREYAAGSNARVPISPISSIHPKTCWSCLLRQAATPVIGGRQNLDGRVNIRPTSGLTCR